MLYLDPDTGEISADGPFTTRTVQEDGSVVVRHVDPWADDPDRTTRRGDTRTDAEIIRQAYVVGVPCCPTRDYGWHALDCHNRKA